MKSDVLGSGPMEGSPEPDMDQAFDLSEMDDSEENSKDSEVRDLSAWRVTLPRLEPRNDPQSGKAFFVFIIQVQRIDMASQTDGEDLEWSVERQYTEFYSLQSALVQYHGVFEDAKLPPRSKLFGGKGLDVLQSKQEPFQDYLVKLLQKPNLKKSDLLYTFLTSKQEFNEASSSKMFKGGSLKLTKEKGQFLQSFINTYVASTQSPPPKPGRLDWEEQLETLKNHPIYKDNFSEHGLFKSATLGPTLTCSITGLYDTLLYLSLRLFRLSEPWLRILTGLRWIVADSVNHLVHYLLSSKIDSLLNSGRVAHILGVIEESIFDPPAPELELAEIQQQTKETLQAFRTYLPGLLRTVLGSRFDPSTQTLFNVVQEPLLNKQLAYTLLETLLVKIFPELRI